jgi:hypothetical protein
MFANLKKDWDKYSNKKLNIFIRTADFLWRKRYKQSLIIICFIGVVLIIYSEQIIKYFFPEISNIKINDKISAIFVWITAVIVFWYSRETLDLKEITRKNLDYERAPYVIFNCEKDKFRCYLKNVGRGLARNVKIDDITLYGNYGFNVYGISLMAPFKTIIESGMSNYTYFNFSVVLLTSGDEGKILHKEVKHFDNDKDKFDFIREIITVNDTIIKIYYENNVGTKYFTEIKFKYLSDNNEIIGYGLKK